MAGPKNDERVEIAQQMEVRPRCLTAGIGLVTLHSNFSPGG
jgi:hypothetical protein